MKKTVSLVLVVLLLATTLVGCSKPSTQENNDAIGFSPSLGGQTGTSGMAGSRLKAPRTRFNSEK